MNNMLVKTQKLLVLLALGFFLAGVVHAGSIRDGRVTVTAAKEDRYKIDSYTFGKAELFGYISELKETKKITGIVLKNGHGKDSQASDEQRHSVASIGNTLQLETFTQDGKDLTPLGMD
jgi:hypothetical protein